MTNDPALRYDPRRDFYALLKVPLTATANEVISSWRTLAFIYHPDRNPGDHERATKRIQALNVAKDVLLNPTKRQMYDSSRMLFWNQRQRMGQPQRQRVISREAYWRVREKEWEKERSNKATTTATKENYDGFVGALRAAWLVTGDSFFDLLGALFG